MNPEHPVSGVGVGRDVKRSVSGGHDRRVVDDIRSSNPNEWAVAGAGDRARRELRGREAVRPRDQSARRTEVRLALEVDDRRSELVRVGRRRIQGDRLHALRTIDG